MCTCHTGGLSNHNIPGSMHNIIEKLLKCKSWMLENVNRHKILLLLYLFILQNYFIYHNKVCIIEKLVKCKSGMVKCQFILNTGIIIMCIYLPLYQNYLIENMLIQVS